jgi:drug/metabolite transporter (DMT)-like permease
VTFVYILLSVMLSALAQISMKAGMSSAEVRAYLPTGSALQIIVSAASSPLVLVGLLLYAISAVLWLGVLARLEVSRAYPFIGLGFIFAMIFAAAFLGERITMLRLLGTLLVIGGVVLVARS